MKTTILKLSAIILLFSFLTAGCQKDDDIFELQIGDENAVIVHQKDGIEFKFCLLNELNEPATVFNEGENFMFEFSFKNLKADTIIVTTEFVYDEFFRVYKVTDSGLTDKGKPWTGIWCEFSLVPHELIVPKEETGKIFFPWEISKETVLLTHPLCTGNSPDLLPAGKYQTGFDLNFHYQINGKRQVIDNLKFKINFELK